jgi:hypothetical protein
VQERLGGTFCSIKETLSNSQDQPLKISTIPDEEKIYSIDRGSLQRKKFSNDGIAMVAEMTPQTKK